MMQSIIVFVSSIIFAANAYADPNQIEIIGLVPGVSTQAQVENAKAEYGYVLGGYELICVPEYIDGLLSQLLCITGKSYQSRDRTASSNRVASNTEVHAALLKGFTKKFGTPSKIDNSSASNRLGATFNRNEVVWIDKKGNKLTLVSMASKIDEGIVFLESAQQLKKNEAERREENQQRKF